MKKGGVQHFPGSHVEKRRRTPCFSEHTLKQDFRSPLHPLRVVWIPGVIAIGFTRKRHLGGSHRHGRARVSGAPTWHARRDASFTSYFADRLSSPVTKRIAVVSVVCGRREFVRTRWIASVLTEFKRRTGKGADILLQSPHREIGMVPDHLRLQRYASKSTRQ